jgi:LemA protein
MIGYIILGIVLLLGISFIAVYNRFILFRNRIDNLEVVKGYAKHEKTLFKEITEERTAMLKASSIKEKASASSRLSSGIKSLFAVAEGYPTLRANENFLALQEEISGTENKIAYSRQFYNDTVMEFNNMAEKFPSSIIASMFSFKTREFFRAEESKRADVKMNMKE